MPKSKRSTIFHLTKTTKKPKSDKLELVQNIQNSANEYSQIFTFKVLNMRNSLFKQVRTACQGRFYLGRNKVMQRGLGMTEEDELLPNSRLISNELVGNIGLLFTNQSTEEVQKILDASKQQDYARAGGIAEFDFSLSQGPLLRFDVPVPHNMEPQLRRLGLPTQLVKGVVELRQDFQVCTTGEVLSPEQAQILVFMN